MRSKDRQKLPDHFPYEREAKAADRLIIFIGLALVLALVVLAVPALT